MQTPVSLVILAAGLGSRFGSDKQVALVSSKRVPLLFFSVHDAVLAGIDHVVVVTRPELVPFFEQNIFPRFKGTKFDIAIQTTAAFCPKGIKRERPWGTGHALLCAKEATQAPFITVNADDFYGRNAIAAAAHFLKTAPHREMCCVGYQLKNTLSPNGTVSRGIIHADSFQYVQKIEECYSIRQEGESITYAGGRLQPHTMASLNLFGLRPVIFDLLEQQFSEFLKKSPTPSDEFGLPQSLLKSNQRVKLIPTEDQWFGMTYAGDLPFIEQQLQNLIELGRY